MTGYQCKISIKDRKPPVWWRVVIPGEISFSALSLLLDELCGVPMGDDFRFEIFRCARVWEPSEERPLAPEFYYGAYSAAHTPVDSLFQLGRSLYCYGSGQALKIEIESRSEDFPFSYPLLVKIRADADGQALYERLKTRFFFSGETTEALSRRELLAGEKDGGLTIGCLAGEPTRGETYMPSSNATLAEMSAYLRKALGIDGDDRLSMRALLGTYSKTDLQKLAVMRKIPGARKKSAEALADELTELLLNPSTVRGCLSLLSDDEIAALESALAAGDEYPIPEGQFRTFVSLSHMGYAFISPTRNVVNFPSELEALYQALDTEDFHRDRRKLNWVLRCLDEIVPPYYAILPMRKFCRLCRRTEDPQISAEEVPALLRQIPAAFTACVVTADKVCSRDLMKDREEYDYVVSVQGDKPWYIMREKEIGELLQYGYPPHETSYRRFKAYLRDSLHLEGPETEEITARLHLLMAYDIDTERYFELLEDHDIRLTRRQLEDVTRLFQDMSNNTPTFYNRGYTPKRMAEMDRR